MLAQRFIRSKVTLCKPVLRIIVWLNSSRGISSLGSVPRTCHRRRAVCERFRVRGGITIVIGGRDVGGGERTPAQELMVEDGGAARDDSFSSEHSGMISEYVDTCAKHVNIQSE